MSTAVASEPATNRELIVVLRDQSEGPPLSFEANEILSNADYLKRANAIVHPLFRSALRQQMREVSEFGMPSTPATNLDMSSFCRVGAPEYALDDLLKKLQSDPNVLCAYLKPPAEAPSLSGAFLPPVNTMQPSSIAAPPITPDFTPQQGYLDPAPNGVGVRHAWHLPGGKGQGIQVIDIEGDWRLTHEDLLQNQGGLAGGVLAQNLGWRNHGTAVLGEFGADENGIGVTGICPAAGVRVVSIFGWPGGPSTSAAIAQAATMLGEGGIILVEIHRAGPKFGFKGRLDQRGYVAVEWWPDDFVAIQYATSRGLLVVEPAGNGAENLDDPIYNQPDKGFPPTWVNPFKRSKAADSGAIVVGAGAPPSGTHGPDRSRLPFSNWGALIDAQGWGEEVTSCGYGDLQGGASEDEWYTASFAGTSSAAPIVVGVLGCLQGVRKAQGKPPLTPLQARALLRTTGSQQQSSPSAPMSERIGNRPDLQQLIQQMP